MLPAPYSPATQTILPRFSFPDSPSPSKKTLLLYFYFLRTPSHHLIVATKKNNLIFPPPHPNSDFACGSNALVFQYPGFTDLRQPGWNDLGSSYECY